MISVNVTWDILKGKALPLRYAETNGNYYVYCSNETVEYSSTLEQGTSESDDFEANYKTDATNLI